MALIAGLILVSGGVIIAGRDRGTAPPAGESGADAGAPLVNIALPTEFSSDAELGKRAFDAKCATCHGSNAAGQDGVAPPLVHKIYEPGHHGDEAFQLAVVRGVRSHHWPFGDMKPVDGLTRAEVQTIVVYIRELQRANGIN